MVVLILDRMVLLVGLVVVQAAMEVQEPVVLVILHLQVRCKVVQVEIHHRVLQRELVVVAVSL